MVTTKIVNGVEVKVTTTADGYVYASVPGFMQGGWVESLAIQDAVFAAGIFVPAPNKPTECEAEQDAMLPTEYDGRYMGAC